MKYTFRYSVVHGVQFYKIDLKKNIFIHIKISCLLVIKKKTKELISLPRMPCCIALADDVGLELEGNGFSPALDRRLLRQPLSKLSLCSFRTDWPTSCVGGPVPHGSSLAAHCALAVITLL